MKYHSSLIEPLETRIAPALLVTGANLLGGNGNPTTGETSIGENQVTLVKVLSGQALVWYDASSNNIVGISVGPNTKLDITGDINGSIITNLTSKGRLTDSDNNPANGEDGGVLLAHTILGIKTTPLSNEKGSLDYIIAGGSIKNLDISGGLGGAYAGNGVFRTGSDLAFGAIPNRFAIVDVGIDVNPLLAGNQTEYGFLESTASFAPVASITNAKIQTGMELQLFAGDGKSVASGAAGAGGNIKNIAINEAFSAAPSVAAYELRGGDGGNSVGGAAGAGGKVSKVLEKTSFGLVTISGGNGGNSSANAQGKFGLGGAGGQVSLLDLRGSSTSYDIRGGEGGDGRIGGMGGGLKENDLGGRGPDASVILAGDFNSDGLDDVVAINGDTGEMVISLNNSSNNTFSYLFQEDFNPDNDPSAIIPGNGTGATSGALYDFDGDSDLDIIVGYSGSASVLVYINQGGGQFYSVNDTGPATVKTLQASVGGPVTSLVLGDFTGTSGLEIGVVTSDVSKTAVTVLGFKTEIVDLNVVYSLESLGSLTILKRPDGSTIDLPVATDAIFGQIAGGASGDMLVSFTDGTILTLLGANFDPEIDAPVFVSGGSINAGFAITSLSEDPGLERVLVFGSGTKSLQLFEFNSGFLTSLPAPDISSLTGSVSAVEYVKTSDSGYQILVVENLPTGSRLNYLVFDFGLGSYVTDKSINGPIGLNKIVAVDENGSWGVAGMNNSISQFYFTDGLTDFISSSLPYKGKLISLFGGNGGDALSIKGAGGDGGAIISTNADADTISMIAGFGGGSIQGSGGNGGSVKNSATFFNLSGEEITPTFEVTKGMTVVAGNGGSPIQAGEFAAGGNGGSISALTIRNTQGELVFAAGSGGLGHGGNGGIGGNIKNMDVLNLAGGMSVGAGNGGNTDGTSGNGGKGGSISIFIFAMEAAGYLEVDETLESIEQAFVVEFMAGNGGFALAGSGGNGGIGGSISGLTLTLDPSDISLTSTIDSTVHVSLVAGLGGGGDRKGGSGGGVSDIKSTTIYDQILSNEGEENGGVLLLNPVIFEIVAGNGGDGGTSKGGTGGGVNKATLLGVSHIDINALSQPDAALTITSGNGGNGGTAGGAAGKIANIIARNSQATGEFNVATTMLSGANLFAGKGGNGTTKTAGAGGGISTFEIAVQSLFNYGGSLVAVAGNGGDSASGDGGAGGSITKGFGGAVDFNAATGQALVFVGGDGGNGAAGGSGGIINDLRVNASPINEAIACQVFAGDGGNASATGENGGKGGDIIKVRQSKDLNSAINVLSAGSGGDSSSGSGGKGGSVKDVNVLGFIGKPSDGSNPLGVFDGAFAQGIFAGLGGAGAASGKNGSVMDVIARQISAIGASADGITFKAATKVAQIQADLIGYDVDQDGVYDDAFGNDTNPSDVQPLDGFIFASSVSGIDTINNTRTGAFTKIA